MVEELFNPLITVYRVLAPNMSQHHAPATYSFVATHTRAITDPHSREAYE